MRKAVLSMSVLAGLVLAAVVFWPRTGPGLDVVLRCKADVAGVISLSGAALDQPLSLPAAEACAQGNLLFERYTHGAPVLFRYGTESGQSVSLDLSAEAAISFSNATHYFVVIDLSVRSPFAVISGI